MTNTMKAAGKAVGARVGVVTGVTSALMFSALMLAGAASAAEGDPQTIDGAFADLQTKITTYGGAVVGLVVASVILFFGIKFLRRGASKA
jgi:hypothetical protein